MYMCRDALMCAYILSICVSVQCSYLFVSAPPDHKPEEM